MDAFPCHRFALPVFSCAAGSFAGSLFALLLLVTGAVVAPATAAPDSTEWRVGVASAAITPEASVWMAGYAARSAPSQGVAQELYAKALAVDDGAGGRVVLVTTDLIGIPRSLRNFVERECGSRFGLKPEQLLLNASHTHCGPEVRLERMEVERNASQASPEVMENVRSYRRWLEDRLVQLVGEAWDQRKPAELEFSFARAGFAMNRRRPKHGGGFSNNPNPAGPVDQEVPVLSVSAEDGSTRAVLFGYACHNTTLSGYELSGDYAGYAQQYVEEAYPGATALFMTGCGGDQNPYPRRNMVPGQPPEELVRQHGRALANAVFTALAAEQRSIQSPLITALEDVRLDYQLPSARELQERLREENTPVVEERIRDLLQLVEAHRTLPGYPCPVQVLRFGDDLALVALGGEVVVDYSLRLKRELAGARHVWVAGYSNDVFGYLASRRIIEEGGYEGGGANTRILNHPGPFALDTEERVVGKVHELWRRVSR